MLIRENIKKKILYPKDVSKILHSIWKAEDKIDRDKEHFWVIGVNTKKMVRYVELVSLGILNNSIVHSRETFRLAISKGIHSIIIGHNHPSDDIIPSEEDLKLTNRLCAAGKILGIEVLDHIIIADGKYYSFFERGHKMGEIIKLASAKKDKETTEIKEDDIGKSIQISNSLHNVMIDPLIKMIRDLKKKELKRGEILELKKRLKSVVLSGFLLLGVSPTALEEYYRLYIHSDRPIK